MKKLYLIRHAKSSWDNPKLIDFERPLNERGYRDAPLMGKFLKEEKIIPDLIISSPALRAYFTARTIASSIGYSLKKIRTSELLYDTDAEDIFEVVNSVKEKYNSLMLFGHNPALTQFSNYVSDKKIDNIPTTGFVEIEMNVTTWKEVVVDCGNIKRFLSPKILMNK